MNDDKTSDPSENIDSNLGDIKPSLDPTPAQAVNSAARLAIGAAVALIAFIAAAAAYVLTHFK